MGLLLKEGIDINLIKSAWKPYGVDLQISAPGIKSIIKWGTITNEKHRRP